MLQVSDVVELVGPAVVSAGRGRRRGSGIVVAPDRIVALARLAGEEVRVGIAGEEASAAVAAVDARRGLALLEVPTGSIVPPRWSTEPAQLGDAVFALGDPGSGLRATEGRISAAPISLRAGGRMAIGALEHTAPLPRGSGGAPLLDSNGRLLGINVLRSDPGFILALDTSVARASVERMLGGAPAPARLGVAVAPSSAAARMRRAVGLPERDGVLVREVEAGSAAERAGLRPGDLLVRLGETELTDIDRLYDALEGAAAGSTVDVVRGVDELRLAIEFSAGAA